ncbi:L,D-transpeptidase family protein [Anaerosalibacter massiliensis]|uniref:L,D-transpeptidase family protein n=1 Tax=Anaerosalibacter massiliensis TaxID=1347392 RepID=A0A9X2MHP8_9FIRM|nr:L,D-transpeptidase family protein [Anaerosalibacter massiliensis]MCR2043300.1 L,D-transpeptidase family protein [Anaerosalibacter massiliensis]
MRKNSILVKSTIISIFILLLFFTNVSYAKEKVKTNEDILKEYIDKGFKGGNIEQRNTLLRFQAENNLTVDGVLGEDVKKALDEKNKENIDKIPEEIKSRTWFIVINKSKKILTVYRKGEVYKKYPVALGRASTPTPDYQCKIINKFKNPYWGGMGKYTPIPGGAPNNPLGKRWLGLSTEKHSGYGIHGNISPYSIGGYVSNGCIRMINEDVEELYKYLPLKTQVWIGDEELLKKWGIEQYIEYNDEKNEENISIDNNIIIRGIRMIMIE